MKRSAKGADALNNAATRGIQKAKKRTIPKGNYVGPPFSTLELMNLDKMVRECKDKRKRDALIRWRRKVLANTALDRWKENVSKPATTDLASWNLKKLIYALRILTSPALLVNGHPLTKHQKAQGMANMYKARSTKTPHASGMKIPRTRRSALRPITEAGLEVALRDLYSGKTAGDYAIHCEELKLLEKVTKKCVLRLFNCSLRTERVQAKWRHGIIVPLLKPNKSASSVASFRSATLTRTLDKLMEHFVARRVRGCIEDNL
ncbi:uncharacterized protein TEOVI_000431800 [Trypanosoma equiperdum]|uniref:Uncharacterized protein n=1 Tax=Trypanosoma equiperdum TaxID=5694 RepID=A0A1G4IJM1_TRYEQ|nr:hypothetical protein TEOVI_000431800 [Trypanosoma equiperdum]